MLARAKSLLRNGWMVPETEWVEKYVDVGSSNYSGINVEARQCTCQNHLGKTMVIHFSQIMDTSENVDVNVKDLLDISAQCLCERVWKPSEIYFRSKCINIVWQFHDGVPLSVFWTPKEDAPYINSNDLRLHASEIKTIAGISEAQADNLQRALKQNDNKNKIDLDRRVKKLNSDAIKIRTEIKMEQDNLALRKAVLFGQIQRKKETQVEVVTQNARINSLQKRITSLHDVVHALGQSPVISDSSSIHTLDLGLLSGLWDNLAEAKGDIYQESARSQEEKKQLQSKLEDVEEQEIAIREEIEKGNNQLELFLSTKRKGQQISETLSKLGMLLRRSKFEPSFLTMVANFEQVVSEFKDKNAKRKSQMIRESANFLGNPQNDVTPQIQILVEDLEVMRLEGLDLVMGLEQLKTQLVAGIACVDDCIERCDVIKANVDELLNKLEEAGR